jgi:hypothetical protein
MTAQAAASLWVMIVTGLSGEPQYAKSFATQAAALYDAAKDRWGVRDSGLVYLAEDPAADPRRITGRSTLEAIRASLTRFAARARPNDVVAVFLIGHGSEQGEEPKLSLPGPDLSPGDLAVQFAALGSQTVVLVDLASASGGFLAPISAARRVVITATKSGFERNATVFGEYFVTGLAGGAADVNKDGRVTLAEAYTYARAEVARFYQSANRLQSEHAQLDDDGDRHGSAELGVAGDGGVARTIGFPTAAEPVSADPAVAALLADRRRLESEIAALRGRKASLDSTAYSTELERLLVALAETNQKIRAKEGKAP